MNHGWSPSDKASAKTAAEKARRRAEQEAVKLFGEYKVGNIDDLWALELAIRQWRKHRDQRSFTMIWQSGNGQLAAWLHCKWLQESDLAKFSPERLKEIKALKATM